MKTNTARWLWRIHQWTGLATGLILIVLMWSGAAAVFLPELDEITSGAPVRVAPAGEMDLNAVYREAVEAAKARNDHPHVPSIRLPESPDRPAVVTAEGRLEGYSGLKSGAAFWMESYYIDPYTAEVLQVRDYLGSFGFWLRSLHVRLFDGLFGREVVGLFGLVLFVSCATGLLIYGRFMASAFYGVVRTRTLRITSGDLHKFLGVTVLGFNLLMAVTGFWIGWQHRVAPKIGFERPDLYSREAVIEHDEDEHMVPDLNRLLELGQAALPEMKAGVISLSQNGQRTASILGDVPGYPYQKYSSTVVLDKETLEVLYTFAPHKGSLGEKLFYAQESVHMGDFGGWAVKVVYLFLGILSGTLGVTGFFVYFGRTARKKSGWWTGLRPVLLWTAGTTVVLVISYVSTAYVGGTWTMFYWTVFFYFALVPVSLLLVAGYSIRAVFRRYRARHAARPEESP